MGVTREGISEEGTGELKPDDEVELHWCWEVRGRERQVTGRGMVGLPHGQEGSLVGSMSKNKPCRDSTTTLGTVGSHFWGFI